MWKTTNKMILAREGSDAGLASGGVDIVRLDTCLDKPQTPAKPLVSRPKWNSGEPQALASVERKLGRTRGIHLGLIDDVHGNMVEILVWRACIVTNDRSAKPRAGSGI